MRENELLTGLELIKYELEACQEELNSIKRVLQKIHPEFYHSLEFINTEFRRRGFPEKLPHVLYEWGIRGGESDFELRVFIEDYISFIKD